jgi:hypothetical protein
VRILMLTAGRGVGRLLPSRVLQATKAHVRLNTKNLYCADGYAVRELLKVGPSPLHCTPQCPAGA